MSLKLSDEVKLKLKKLSVLVLTFASGFILGNALAYPKHVTLTIDNSTYITEVNDQNVQLAINDISLSDKSKPYYLLINGPGGYVHSGMKLTKLLDTSPHVICVAVFAASMDFQILQSCKTRLILKDSIIMQHRIGLSASGSPDDLRRAAEEAEKLEDLLNIRDAARLELPLKEFKEKIKSDWWMYGAEEILRNKAADAVITASCDTQLIETGHCKLYD